MEYDETVFRGAVSQFWGKRFPLFFSYTPPSIFTEGYQLVLIQGLVMIVVVWLFLFPFSIGPFFSTSLFFFHYWQETCLGCSFLLLISPNTNWRSFIVVW